MASINKLSIRGIRSFSHEREQVIEFYTPLTMIVGANGCGKTTVIECLKYACTGALPPGARNGQSFVHDPKVSGTNEVKANIKLRFAGRDGRVSVVIRSFQLTQKKVTLQFKALDGVIRTKDDNGVGVSITHKCTELDKHIPLRLGVSKAILENVVFCHQEDSSWPLQEGAVVKKKFDDIFESARYTKALDTIKKTKQEYAVTVKDLKIDLAGLQERLRAAESLKSELEESQESYNKIRKEIESIDARTKEVSETLEKLHVVADKIGLLEGQKQSLQLTCRDLDVRMGEKRENVGDTLSKESDEALEKSLMEFDEMLDKCADDIRFYQDEVEKCTRLAQAAKKSKDALQGQQGQLQAQLSHQERVVAGRDGLMEKLSKRHDIFNPAASAPSDSSGSGRRYSSEDISSFENALQRALRKAKASLESARSKTRVAEDKMNTDMNALKIEQRSSSDAVTSKVAELRKIQGEQQSLTQGGGSAGAGSQSQLGTQTMSKLERQLKDAQKQKDEFDKEYSEFQKNDKTAKLTKEIKTLEGKIAQLKDSVSEQEGQVKTLSEHQEEQSRIAVKTVQIADDTELLVGKVKDSTTFKDLLGGDLEEVTRESLGDAITELRQKKREVDGEFRDKSRVVIDLGREVATEATNRRIKATELRDVRQQVEGLSSVVDVVREEMAGMKKEGDAPPDPEKDFDLILQYWTDREIVYRGRSTTGETSRELVASLRDEGRRTRTCPSCRRHMDDAAMEDFEAVQRSLLDDTKRAEKIARDKRRLEAAQASISKLRSNAQRWRDWVRLTPQLPRLEEAVAAHERAEDAKSEELARAKEEQEELRERIQQLDEGISRVRGFADEADRIEGVRQDVRSLEAKQQMYGHDGSLSEAQEKLRTLYAERDDVGGALESKRKELQQHTGEQLKKNKTSSLLTALLADAKSALEFKKEFERKKEALRERQKTLEAELKELRLKAEPLRLQVQEMANAHDSARELARASLDRLHGALQECQADVKTFSRSQAEVAAGLAKKLPEALAEIQARLQETETTVENNEKGAKKNEMTISGMVLRSNKQAQHKKLLRDNIDYRALTRELKERQVEVQDVNKKIAETNSEDVRVQIQELNRDMTKMNQKRAELKGRLHGMKDQIRGFENKLASDAYNRIEEKHRRKMIEHRTTEMAVTDLDKYWTALDKALLRFHTMKIADINKIIRELWAMTYSGEDIDMIEIVSGDDEETGKAKRSYNYRVVMRKNDATLDMKGRCSAGQRVLASVVIRLALAETFCVSCGILALDEPTTNLDHNNKVGLAHALAKIINSRSKQSNFQLITITHDEDFVQTMRTELGTQGGFSMPEHYWRISREEVTRGKFYSRIDRLDWEDM